MIKILKFLKDDLKSDYDFIRNIKSNEEHIDERMKEFKEAFKPNNMKRDMQQNWIWILIVIAAVLVGMFVSAKYYQNECNQFIYEEYIQQEPYYIYEDNIYSYKNNFSNNNSYNNSYLFVR
ncbi:hypothetical protein A3K72_01920 [Candidatus Woesearchaeota archaeon RBG_13_36_6]|nr:MAG: hypothetical protein A3K72_01920 [Candidatus Woesearchaeota archaeon RBG_13_36_6]